LDESRGFLFPLLFPNGEELPDRCRQLAGKGKKKGLAVAEALLFFLVELDGIEPTAS